jgi:hypothetical protein
MCPRAQKVKVCIAPPRLARCSRRMMPVSSGIMFLMYRTRGRGPLVHKTTPAALGWGKAMAALVEVEPVAQYNAANNTRIIKAGAKQTESSDPMREAGEPSTGNVIVCCVALCPPHRGSHGLTTDIPAQRTTGQSEGRAKCDGDEPARPRAQYKGRSPKAPSEVLEELQ